MGTFHCVERSSKAEGHFFFYKREVSRLRLCDGLCLFVPKDFKTWRNNGKIGTDEEITS